MSTRDQDLQVPDEPEDQVPLGTGEEGEFESDGLAAEPYADEIPFEPARVRVPRSLLVGVILVLIVALLVLMAIACARGSWWLSPLPTLTSAPFSPTSLP